LVEGRHFVLDPGASGLAYQTSPSLSEAWAFAESVDPALPLAFDIETPMSTRSDEDERTSFTDRDIKLFQCTQRRGEGLAIPFREEYVDIIRRILGSVRTRVGFNNWSFDDPVIAANGIDVGETDDAMVMFGFAQPDLPKNLQAAAQWCGFPFPWKSLGETDLEFYGCADVDSTLCVYQFLRVQLEREGRWETFRRYFAEVWSILRDMASRGVPVSEERRSELKALIEREDQRVTAAVRGIVPSALLGVEPKHGYKRVPKDITGLVEREFTIEKEEKCQCVKAVRGSCAVCAGTGIIASGSVVRRWASPVEFNPNSSHQVKRFMKHLKHPVPKHAKRLDATGEASDTTEVKELERLYAKTKHPIYPLLIEKRQLTKVEGTYVTGWAPSKDGRVHTTYTFQTATWQTSSRAPNVQNGLKHSSNPFQKALALGFNSMLRANLGYRIVNFDFKSFHALTTAFQAESKPYERLARIDIHSFLAAHAMRLPEASGLYERPDEEMADLFRSLKKREEFKFYRDFKAKRCIAEGELVLTDQGLIPIQNVTLDHLLWDGVEWVHHEGLIDQGIRKVITYEGLTATPDHEVILEDGTSALLGKAASRLDRLLQTGNQGEAIRTCHRDKLEALAERRIHKGADEVPNMRKEGYSRLSFSEIGAWERLPELRTDEIAPSNSVGETVRRNNFAVLESTQSGLSELRRTGDSVSLQLPQWVRAVCGEDIAARFVPWRRDRQNRQQRPLRTGESETGDAQRTSSQSTTDAVDSLSRPENADGPVQVPIQSMVDLSSSALRANGRANSGKVLARTYDIANAGPRRCFTVSGKLVLNCVLGIQFGMGFRKLYQMYREDYESEAEAKMLHSLMMDSLFPDIKRWQAAVKAQAAEDKRLVSLFGAVRHFYDVQRWDRKRQAWVGGDQAEQAVAFLPANHAFGVMREVMLRLREKELDAKYGLFNTIHDSLVFHCRGDLVGECMDIVAKEMSAPSPTVRGKIAPDGLSVGVEVGVGESLADLH
jgi:DNA polymerase family A